MNIMAQEIKTIDPIFITGTYNFGKIAQTSSKMVTIPLSPSLPDTHYTVLLSQRRSNNYADVSYQMNYGSNSAIQIQAWNNASATTGEDQIVYYLVCWYERDN